jgi:hypothetical protein
MNQFPGSSEVAMSSMGGGWKIATKKGDKGKHVELGVYVLRGAAPGRVAASRDFATPLEIAVQAHEKSGKRPG